MPICTCLFFSCPLPWSAAWTFASCRGSYSPAWAQTCRRGSNWKTQILLLTPFRLIQHWEWAPVHPEPVPCTQSHSHAQECRELRSHRARPAAALEALQHFCLQSGQVLTSESAVWQTWAPEPSMSPQLEQRALKRSSKAGSKWLENWKGGLL